ncbi:MAG: STAS domain-containing protein [Parasporobacterium sp.]|nr:STAS domain-containing protein [Parasporobacterium sp.]
MTIQTQKQEKQLIVFLEGRLDTNSSPELEEYLKSRIDEIRELVFDFEHLEYISSAGLRVLLAAQKQMNRQGSMIVRNVSEPIREIFDVTGFCDILTIEA